MDRRLMCLQKRIGFRHFGKGVSRFRQHTCRETRDLERVFLGVIQGHTRLTPKKMAAFRAFMDFVYLAQYPSHDDETLSYMRRALRTCGHEMFVVG